MKNGMAEYLAATGDTPHTRAEALERYEKALEHIAKHESGYWPGECEEEE